jgi:probable phosphoglycerate mutase
MTEVVVVRHGETDWNVEGRIQGHRESELNARGRMQAEAVGAWFREAEVDAIYSSDLKRTMDTAREIAAVLRLEIVEDKRLREWKLGVLETRLVEEVRASESEAVRIYNERDVDAVVPGGESVRQRYARATGCLKEITERHPDAVVVVVTHGGILDDVYRFAKGIDLEAERTWDLHNCGISRIRFTEGTWEVLSWGEVEHLEKIGSMADWGGEAGEEVGG